MKMAAMNSHQIIVCYMIWEGSIWVWLDSKTNSAYVLVLVLQ
uniref:Uncharacterized protein n=1 Tax=Amphimedon queenslandica TaxID=400682 RepID=A0A1X7VM29_AMPQE